MQQQQRRDSLGEGEVEAPPQLPLTDGRYYACRRCRRILSEAQWFSAGCVECSATMGIPDRDNLLDFATPHFHNFIGLIAPGQSWVARLIMKARAETNGIFAETLSDDESAADEEDDEGELDDGLVEEGEEGEGGVAGGHLGEGATTAAAVSPDVAAWLGDDDDAVPRLKVSAAPAVEPPAAVVDKDHTAEASNDNNNGNDNNDAGDDDDVEGLLRDVKRVKTEPDHNASA